MKNLANIALDLLCLITFRDDDFDEDRIIEAQTAHWQTLIHQLEDDERSAVIQTAEEIIAYLDKKKSLQPYEIEMQKTLSSYIEGDLN